MSRPHRPRGLVVFVALLLAGGAIINVAVTATVWLRGQRPASGTLESIDLWEAAPASSQEIATWKRWAQDTWPNAPATSLHQSTFGMQFTQMITAVGRFDLAGLTTETWQEKAKQRSLFSIVSTACGWPVPCFSVDCASEEAGLPPKQKVRRGGWQMGRMWIPNEISLHGFLLNTTFYAAIVWLPFGAARVIRRKRRIKRGLCPACAYPVGSSDVCTECGRPVTATTQKAPIG